ncbi:hypothetical protein CU044_5275 [Streptomyces sp. L-9-10]|nr:hypothetical protein CU044_5275 [Streptomyces sp. L-9-10]
MLPPSSGAQARACCGSRSSGIENPCREKTGSAPNGLWKTLRRDRALSRVEVGSVAGMCPAPGPGPSADRRPRTISW